MTYTGPSSVAGYKITGISISGKPTSVRCPGHPRISRDGFKSVSGIAAIRGSARGRSSIRVNLSACSPTLVDCRHMNSHRRPIMNCLDGTELIGKMNRQQICFFRQNIWSCTLVSTCSDSSIVHLCYASVFALVSEERQWLGIILHKFTRHMF